jgi:RNA polymerase sigma-70 factor (ECF subfamily)
MTQPQFNRDELNGSSPEFPPTRWSLVGRAGDQHTNVAADALETLCRAYWYPLYAFVRKRGYDAHTAEDLTQSFFAHLFENGSLQFLDRDKGKFRTFLLTGLTNFLNNDWNKQAALKRGGGVKIIPWDEVQAEELYSREPNTSMTPEELFERRWAFTLIELVLERQRREYETADKQELFALLSPYLTTGGKTEFFVNVAAKLKMSEGAVKVALHRMRRRFGELLRRQIAHTVTSPDQVEEEIRHLFTAISR